MNEGQPTFGRTIQIFLADGSPTGLIIASIFGWTGSVVVANQSNFARLLNRPELERSGVYILYGPDPSDPLKMRAYIGEADNVKERIASSADERVFWETAAVVTTSDDALTKGHIRYLEARMIQVAVDSQRVAIDNTQRPQSDRRRLPEADRANIEAFLSNLQMVLPVVGLDLLRAQPRPVLPAPLTAAGVAPSTSIHPRFEIRHRSGVSAAAEEIDGEFIVLSGSLALKSPGYSSNNYTNLRKNLVDQGVLIEDTDERYYRFQVDYAFNSVSAAAAVILDRNANGRTEWKVAETGATYSEWQRQSAGLDPEAV
jgi:hypothetical protein